MKIRLSYEDSDINEIIHWCDERGLESYDWSVNYIIIFQRHFEDEWWEFKFKDKKVFMEFVLRWAD